MAETTGKHLFVVCMNTPSVAGLAMAPATHPGPVASSSRLLANGFWGCDSQSGFGYASTSFPDGLGLVRCPVSNLNEILVLRRPARAWWAAD
jgi:hypothetical protein